jgi:2-polyprenyl-3-methyl-5-hydroxy-6-metoxy-1,4-benzoquinol methylase
MGDTMTRRLEPELMEDPDGAAAYARADFRDSNDLFVTAVQQRATTDLRTAVDLGCGPGDLTLRLAGGLPDVSFTAVDGSAPMIALARSAVARAGLEHRVMLLQERLQSLPLRSGGFDAVLSKDLLHHLPDPSVLWTTVAHLGRPAALVCVMDLVRPPTLERARAIVDTVASGADEILRQDFYNSLRAAFTVDEVRAQLSAAGLDLRVERISDRHMLVDGHLTA